METYDYRITIDRLNQADSQIESLSKQQLLRLSETAKAIKQSDENRQIDTATTYFHNAILPAMKEFAEMCSCLLIIEKNDNMQTIIATFQCSCGFDITESCRLMRGWLAVSNHIGISIEDGEPTLSLTFDCNDFY